MFVRGAAYGGNGLVVQAGGDGSRDLRQSVDFGRNFTSPTITGGDTGEEIRAMAYGNGFFMGVSHGGQAIQGTVNGAGTAITWTSSAIIGADLNYVTFASGLLYRSW